MIERNRNPSGKFATVVFGVCQVVDGVVRVVSLGYFHTKLPLECSKWQAKRALKNRGLK